MPTDTRPQFQREFPRFPADALPEIPRGFTDTSWHNDVCPSFTHDELLLKLWVNYPDPRQREVPEAKSFSLQRINEHHELAEDLLDTDDWQEVASFIAKAKASVS